MNPQRAQAGRYHQQERQENQETHPDQAHSTLPPLKAAWRPGFWGLGSSRSRHTATWSRRSELRRFAERSRGAR